ncbi:Swt1 family HEPN domain-containing protein [Qipengyuania profunda]|jgi:hypothetical protein|uniref:Swt1 family HEPN domain-containing protein n=1 Tax=Qipengyuania profunda TaxID=3113984 RepID=UPI002A18C57C|nr:Swt1 family HEPN domain-containing protein [Qipengyuania sp. HL-TH1]WPL55514.1 Swt1 family HEPN domain-containing protein [Qipengyuania sp. HL-TH5]
MRQDDPISKVMRDLQGGTLASLAAGKDSSSQLIERAMRGHSQYEKLIARQPDFVEQALAHQKTYQDLIDRHPAFFDTARQRAEELSLMASNGTFDLVSDRLGAIAHSASLAERMASGSVAGDTFASLVAGRGLLDDTVADILAKRDALAPVMERLQGVSTTTEAFARQLAGLSQAADALAGIVPSRARLATDHPDLFPELRVPTMAEVAQIDFAAIAGVRHAQVDFAERLRTEVLAIETPWVRADRPELALEGYAAFRGLTDLVARAAPGTPRVAERVREEFGDYRKSKPEEDVAEDAMLARGLRLARGFDRRLSSLPMALVGSIFMPFGMTVEAPPDADEDELDLVVATMARQLERKLRAFIAAAMVRSVGPKWIRQRVHSNVREEWERRRQVDVDMGRAPGELFDYADFGDYRAIIERNDNWQEIFKPIFKNKVSIGETLSRLATIRNPVAHVRPLTVEDLLILRVEGRRIYVWIGEMVP